MDLSTGSSRGKGGMFTSVFRGFSRPDPGSPSSLTSTSYTFSSSSSSSSGHQRFLSNPGHTSHAPSSTLKSSWEIGTLEGDIQGHKRAATTTVMSSTLAPPESSAAKRYSNLFRGSRNSMLPNNEDTSAPSFFDDLAFLDETGGLATSTVTKTSKPVKLRPLRKNKEKTHASKSSTSSFLKKGGARRPDSLLKASKAQSITTTTTTTFVEYPFYEGSTREEPSVDLTESIMEEEGIDESPLPVSRQSSDGDADVGFFSDLAFLEAQQDLSAYPKSPKSPKARTKPLPSLNAGSFTTKSSSSSGKARPGSKDSKSPMSSPSSTFTRFRTANSTANSSSNDSIRSRTSSLKSSVSINTLTSPAPVRRTSQSPSHTSVPSYSSPLPSLTTHSSSPSLSSTALPSPSGTYRHGSGSISSTKVLPALPVDFSAPDEDTARAATFGQAHPSPRPSARYLFDPPSPKPIRYVDSTGAKHCIDPPSPRPHTRHPTLDLTPRSPRGASPAENAPGSPPLRRDAGGPIPPPKHTRQRSANYQVPQPELTARPPRHSSLNASGNSGPPTPTTPPTERLNRASLSAVLAREEKERSSDSRRTSRSSAYSSSSPVTPTAEDLALLPTAPFSRMALASTAAPPVPPMPSGLAPPPSWSHRRTARNSVMSDGVTASPCNSIIAAFPAPPELGADDEEDDDDGRGYSRSLNQTMRDINTTVDTTVPQRSNSAESRHLSTIASSRAPSIDLPLRPESDAFTFDDDYWLATPAVHTGGNSQRSSLYREESITIPQPLRLRGQSGRNGATTPTSPTLLTPELMYPALIAPTLSLPLDDTRRYIKNTKTSSLDGSTVDINSLIEHARPESATLPDFVNVDREGSLMSARSTHVVPSDDGTDYYDEDHEELLSSGSDHEGERQGLEDHESTEDHGNQNYETPEGEIFEHDADHVIHLDTASDDDTLLKADTDGVERADTPTSLAARIDAFLALESLASAAGYRLVRASFVPPREEDEEHESTTPTTPNASDKASTAAGQS